MEINLSQDNKCEIITVDSVSVVVVIDKKYDINQ